MCGARCTRSLLASEMKSSRRIYLEKRRKSCEWETITIIIYKVSCVQFAYISLSHPPFGTVCGAWSTVRSPTPERGTEWRIKCWLSVVSCARLQNWNCRIAIMLLCECHTNQLHGIVPTARYRGSGAKVSISHSWEIRWYALQFSGDVYTERYCIPESLWLHARRRHSGIGMALLRSEFHLLGSNLYCNFLCSWLAAHFKLPSSCSCIIASIESIKS